LHEDEIWMMAGTSSSVIFLYSGYQYSSVIGGDVQ
jgi:hypothetical protein